MLQRQCLRFACLFLLVSLLGTAVKAQVVFGGAQKSLPINLVTGDSGGFSPDSAAIDGAGNIYFADTYNNRIIVYNPQTKSSRIYASFSGPNATKPGGLAWSEAGLIATDYSNNTLLLVASDGSTSVIPTPGLSPALTRPTGAAIDAAGNLYVADSGNHRILKLIPGTSTPVVFSVGSATPRGLAVDTGGNIYFSDPQSNNVYRMLPDGTSISAQGGGLSAPVGLSVDSSNNIYVADHDNNRIVEIPANGGTQIVLGTGLRQPAGVIVDAAGNLIVSDQANHRVVTIAPNPNGVDVGTSSVGDTSPQPIALIENFSADESGIAASLVSDAPYLNSIDWSDAGGSTCSGDFASGGQCVEYIDFTPQGPGSSKGSFSLSNNSGTLFTIPFSGVGVSPLITFAPAASTVVLGSEPPPVGMDKSGNVYLVTAQGQITLHTPDGKQSNIGTVPLTGNLAGFSEWVTADGAGNLYGVLDSRYDTVMEEIPAAGGPPNYAVAFNNSLAYGSATDGLGNLYFLYTPSLAYGYLVKLQLGGSFTCVNDIPTTTGASTYISACAAGNMTVLAQNLYNPRDIALDTAGNIYVADFRGVDKFSPDGTSKTVLDGGTTLGYLGAVALDSSGNIYTVETDTGRLLELPVGGTTPVVLASNLTGTDHAELGFDANANLWQMTGAPNETYDFTMYDRKSPPALTFTSTPVGQTSNSQTFNIENDGNSPLTFTGLTISQGFAQQGLGANACSASTVLPPGMSCQLQVAMLPTQPGPLTGSIVLTDNQLNLPGTMQTIALSGSATGPPLAAMPTFTPPAGTYTSAQSVTISDTTPGAVIYYTTNGSTPTTSSTMYTGPFAVSASQTIEAIAAASGYTNSAPASAAYTINLPVTPTITWPTPSAISYGTPLSATQLDATSAIPGTFVYTPAAGTILHAGTQPLSVTFTPTDTTNYTTATASVNLLVNPVMPVLSWTTPAAITYGNALSATQLNATSNTAGTFAYVPSAGTILGAGTRTLSVTFTPTDVTDYTTATASVTLQVNQAMPVLTWATPSPINFGTALSAAQLDATSSIAGAFLYNPAAGTIPAVGSDTLSVTFTPTDAADYTAATASVTLVVNSVNPVPVISSLTPALTSAGSAGFSLTVNGSSYVTGSTVYWGTTPLTTQYVSPSQLTASVTASQVASPGTGTISVQSPSPGGGTSNTLQFEIDTAGTGSGTAPVFASTTALVTAGSTATYAVTLPSTATDVSVSCLNAPAGVTCSYASGTVSIATSSSSPKGTWQIIVVFTETLPGAASSLILAPLLLLPLLFLRRKKSAQGIWMASFLSLILLSGAISLLGCGGSSSGPTKLTHQVTSSAAVSLTIQ